MKIRGIIILLALFSKSLNAQIISQFTWDSNPVTTAVIGPNATSVSGSATSSPGGVGGTNGLNAGLPKMNLDFIIPTSSGIFDVAGIDISFDYQRDEGSGNFFKRGNSLIIKGTSTLSVTYRIKDGNGGFTTVNSGSVYNIPNDNTFRTYRFYYLPATGYGALLVNGVEIWNNDGPDKRDMYWTAGDDIIIGENIDGHGSNRTALDNLTIANVNSFPLPIELLSFNATQIENNVQITWQTSTEINNDFFTVEKSIDAISWETVKQIEGAGNSNILVNYEITDDNPYEGLSYYRLKQTDFDGQFSYSKVKSFELNTTNKKQISVYPNPAKNQITIVNSDLNNLRIFNTIGQEVTSLITITGNTIAISNLKNGIYLIKTDNQVIKLYVE